MSKIRSPGADAHLLVVQARDDGQEKSFRALFDRSEVYTEFLQSTKEARSSIGKATEVELHMAFGLLNSSSSAFRPATSFPVRSGKAVDALRQEVELHLSPGEPAPATADIHRQAAEDYQSRTWATRKRPWVDRLATAWLIQRFVDKMPAFVWLAAPRDCPATALGFDFDGAQFTHVGDKVTFEVVAQTFGLLEDEAIKRLGQLVHYIDVGGIPVDEAAGVEMMVRGLQAQHQDDDELLAESSAFFDTLYAALRPAS